jgi:hypothetical protein
MKFYWEEICWKEAVAKLNTIPGGELQYSAPIYPSISTNSPFPLTPKDQPDQTQAGAWWSVRELGKDPEQDQKKGPGPGKRPGPPEPAPEAEPENSLAIWISVPIPTSTQGTWGFPCSGRWANHEL